MASKKAEAKEPDAVQSEEISGVFVRKQTDENGNVSASVQVVGDTRITEAETLLRMGIKSFKEVHGLD